MSIECKVCTSEIKDEIEQMIMQGISNFKIAVILKEKGIDITYASINRHKINHMMEHIEHIKKVAHEKDGKHNTANQFIIDAESIMTNSDLIGGNDDYSKLAADNMLVRNLINRILKNQLAITIDLQEKYMAGESRYPNEQVSGLKTIQEIALKIDEYTRKNFLHFRRIANDKKGVEDYVEKLGAKAKREIDKVNPYVKGAMFSVEVEDYKAKYWPLNPFASLDGLNDNNEFAAYNNGIESAMSPIEKGDYELNNLLTRCLDNEAITYDSWFETLDIYETGNYDCETEMKKWRELYFNRVDGLQL